MSRKNTPSISLITTSNMEVAQTISTLLWHLAEHTTDAMVRSAGEILIMPGNASSRLDRPFGSEGQVTRFRTVSEQESFLGLLDRFVTMVGTSREVGHLFLTDAPLTEHEALAMFARNSSAQLFFVGKVDHPHNDPMTNKIIAAARSFRNCGGFVTEIKPDRDYKGMMRTIIEHSRLSPRTKRQWVSNLHHSGHRAGMHLSSITPARPVHSNQQRTVLCAA